MDHGFLDSLLLLLRARGEWGGGRMERDESDPALALIGIGICTFRGGVEMRVEMRGTR